MTSGMTPKHGTDHQHDTPNPNTGTRVSRNGKSISLSASLTGDQEVPTGSPSARGTSTLSLNEAGNALSYSLTVAGLDFGQVLGTGAQTPGTGDDVTLIHIHDGDRGVNGPVALNLFGAGTQNQDDDDFRIVENSNDSVTITGIWEQSDNTTLPLNNFVSEIRDASANDDIGLYWNVHTTQFPGGAVRGQLQRGAESESESGDTITGSRRNDNMVGTAGDDVMRGLNGNDRLRGLAGDDRLDGGRGTNTMIGGAGADIFVMRRGPGLNIVRDFKADDRMDLLGGLDADDLTIVRQGRNTMIRGGGDNLARLIGVSPNTITDSVFI
ncbi:MAG: CHRD domain-containing protein [Cyanobacteria bacterium CRU_2_1]|nr:CHRD domain-containing protein [Cyanobacteria bacterium RU_5_0]NJR58060.1 CHRD domain-containing protein [Cyanobacteria bacterium CRU_2_1]